jgi:tetratricopeptide (TPR) repeat protein
VLKKVFPSPDLDKALLDLRKRGLLQYAGESQRYDMHPIVRHYAYHRLVNKKIVHQHIANYYHEQTNENVLGQYQGVPQQILALLGVLPERQVEKLEDLEPVIELYHHMVRAENFDEALMLYHRKISKAVFYKFAAYQIQIELLYSLLLDGDNKPPRLSREDAQAWTLNELASAYAMNGQPNRAVLLIKTDIDILKKIDAKMLLPNPMVNIATYQLAIGRLTDAEHNLRLQVDLSSEIMNEFFVSVGHQNLARVLSYCGMWQEADQELSLSFEFNIKQNDYQGLSIDWAYRALCLLFMAREAVIINQPSVNYIKSSVERAQRALEFADETAKTQYPHPRDYVRVHWLLGSTYRANNELTLAEENLSEALKGCREINMVDHEADILLELSKLRHAQGDSAEALRLAQEASFITERSGYVLTGADVNLFLATLSLEGIGDQGLGNREQARKYAEEALRLATCDGGEYTYKVAYDEAEKLLEKLK